MIMSVDYDDEILKSDSDIAYPDYIEYARITCGKENSYFMKTEKITIGRNSADGNVDIDVGPHTFVSRKHLEMMYSYKKLKIKCLGKNGIFIDNYFKAHSSIPYELPYECTLRFPSTNVEVNVKQLVGCKRDDYQHTQNVDEICENRHLSRKRKSQKTNERFNFNLFCESEKESTHFDFPLRRSLETKKEMIVVNNEIKSDSTLSQGSNFVTNRKSSASTFTMSESNNNSNTSKMQNICIETSSTIPQIVLNPRSYRSYSYNGEVIYTHNSQVFSSIYDSKDLAIEYGTDTQKPPYSYAQLIVQAVSSSRDRQLTLNGIYNYISKHYPYFKSHDKGWQNSVRHNLSLNRYFIKVPRGQDEPGKGSFWRVDGAYESKLIAQAFRKRRLRSNNCGSICSDNIPSASRVFSLSGGRTGNICTVSDRSAKLNNIFTLRRSDQKAPTTFVFRKMSDTHQLTKNGVFASASVINKQSDINHGISSISPNNVFHQNKSATTATVTAAASTTISKPGQKRVFQSPHNMVRKTASTATTSTLISIGGKVFSTNKLKPIQLLSTKNSSSCVPVKQQPSGNKYILISSSQIETTSNQSLQNSNQIISITSSGPLNQLSNRIQEPTHKIQSLSSIPVILSNPKLDTNFKYSNHHQPMSPLSVSETCEFALDEPSQLDSSSTELGQLSPSLRFSQSLQQEDDDLDLEMDQFLDSYSILDHPNDIDSNPDMYKEDIDDYCVWQDESLGLQDVEIEIH